MQVASMEAKGWLSFGVEIASGFDWMVLFPFYEASSLHVGELNVDNLDAANMIWMCTKMSEVYISTMSKCIFQSSG